jgi:hypothetical protein
MNTFQEITSAIRRLPRKDFYRVAKWVQKRFNDEWDKEMAEDAKAGRFDKLAAKALADLRAGKTTDMAHLFRSPKNARRLLAAKADLERP